MFIRRRITYASLLTTAEDLQAGLSLSLRTASMIVSALV